MVLGVMIIKESTTLPGSIEQEPHYLMQFNVIHETPFFFVWVSYPSAGDTVSEFFDSPTGLKR